MTNPKLARKNLYLVHLLFFSPFVIPLFIFFAILTLIQNLIFLIFHFLNLKEDIKLSKNDKKERR